MRVDQLMTATAASVGPDSDIGMAIRILAERRCGVLPVTDAERQVVGIVTDRDIALALGAADERPSRLSVGAVMTPAPRSCRVDESAQRALAVMADAQVRRLPVVDAAGRLVGLLSIDDIVLAAQNVRAGVSRVTYEQAMAALEAICARSAQHAVATDPAR